MIASTVVSTGGAIVSGIGQKQQADYQAQVADKNARIAENQAQDSILNTNLEAQRRYRDLAQTKGQQVAAMAANGVDLNFGSAVDVQRDTAATGAEDLAPALQERQRADQGLRDQCLQLSQRGGRGPGQGAGRADRRNLQRRLNRAWRRDRCIEIQD
ncbi:hypothetical protein [Sphingomonas oligophenolica]